MVIKKIPHLVRYFFFIGIITFVGYTKHFQQDIFLVLCAPCIYIAHTLYNFIYSQIITLPNTENVKYFGVLLPVCLVYFSFIGFQLKQLWNERGFVRWVILTVFIGFILYIHYLAYEKLAGYLIPRI